jgi:hypothetical protein
MNNFENDLKRLYQRLIEIVQWHGLEPESLDYQLFETFIRRNSYVVETRNRVLR